ncbi:MAG TPA: ATPase, T2SS/T4P/T4SS family [Skermanella sp.]|nr:ATPase, T2SS/T4P/T4SS family [Skermanella sp.]
MFGKRGALPSPVPASVPSPFQPPPPVPEPPPPPEPNGSGNDSYYGVKTKVFEALLDTLDLTQLGRLDDGAKRNELTDICREIVAVKGFVLSPSKEEELIRDICNDVLGLGPLEPLLARDDISDIMVNGACKVYIEVDGKIELTPIRFRDNAQLMNICQRIVSAVGRRVDETNPICDARLADGSRVNVIAPPLALDGPTLTIRWQMFINCALSRKRTGVSSIFPSTSI